MRTLFRRLCLVFVLPFVLFRVLCAWLLSRLLDPRRFRSITDEYNFDFIGRWATANILGVYGMFGAIAPNGVKGNVELIIYYSRFQGFKRGSLEKRKFAPATSCIEIPVSMRHGSEAFFSFLEGGQLLWFGWVKDAKDSRDGWFASLRPGSYGYWKLTRRPEVEHDCEGHFPARAKPESE